jgi:hypothetical protein
MTNVHSKGLEYFAGHFDGEGCVRLGSHRLDLRIQVGGQHRPALEMYAERWGGSIADDGSASKRGRTPVYVWLVSGYKALKFINDILPYTLEKREQLEVAKHYPMVGVGNKLTEDVKVCREYIYNRLKQLKRHDYKFNTESVRYDNTGL